MTKLSAHGGIGGKTMRSILYWIILLNFTSEQSHANASVDILLDEVIRLCADCDAHLGDRIAIILRRLVTSATSHKTAQEPASAITALRMLVYLQQENGTALAAQRNQIDACMQEIIAWYRRQHDMIFQPAPSTCVHKAAHFLS